MASESQLATERSETLRRPADAGVKTILLHVQNDETFKTRLETGLSLARACKAHLSCLHVTPIEAYVAFDTFGGVFVMKDVMRTVDEEEKQLRLNVEGELGSEDVSWDYTQITGNVPSQIIRSAALADLVVTGREPHRSELPGQAIGLLGELLHRSRTPLLIPGSDGTPVDPTGVAMIAWDGSYEACNAVRASIGLLKVAADVRVVQVREPDKDTAFPSTKLLEYLSRHGIHADLQNVRPVGARGEAIAGILLDHASIIRAAYIVMGGYNHSRIGEFLFGGVTRALLTDSPLPLLMAH